MASKMIFLFLLIAGAFAANDLEFDLDLVESEDVDLVARTMNEDLQLLEEEVMFEMKDWCDDVKSGLHPHDEICDHLE